MKRLLIMMIIALNLMTPSPLRAQTAIGGNLQVFTDMSLIESLTHAVLKQHEPGQRPNGTVSVNAGYAGGEMITKPFTFTGRRLVLNYATSAAGSIRVEIQNVNGTPIQGYALANFPERYLDEVEGVMKWGSVVDVGSLAGTPVRLRFVLKDADLYAMRFANPDNVQNSVSYNANGANGGTAPSTQTKEKGVSLVLAMNAGDPLLYKTGYTFAGWNTAADGSGTSYAECATYTHDAPLTLYARWAQIPTTYTVTFNKNGATSGLGPAAMNKIQGVALTLPSNITLARTGYTFAGWNTAADGNGTDYAVGAGYTTDAAITLYAKWTVGTEIKELYNSAQAVPAINIGGRLELFVDNYLIQTLSNATLRLHQPVDRGALFSTDAAWEGNYSGFPSVVKDGNKFYAYNRGLHRLSGDPMVEVTKYAFRAVTCFRMSSDGINWEIPSVGSHAFNGSTDNSIIWTNWGHGLEDGWSACFQVAFNGNPNASAQERFIALGSGLGENDGVRNSGRYATFVSPDGVNFTMKKANCIVNVLSDSNGEIFWDSNIGQYVTYTRIGYNPITGERAGAHLQGYYRWVERRLSTDLVNFSAPELLSFRDASGSTAPAVHLYSFPAMQYSRAPHLYIAIANCWMKTRKAIPEWYRDGVNDGVFLTSRDGLVWDRTFMEAFIRPGTDRQNWTSKAQYPVTGQGVVIQTGTNELSVYWYDNTDHGDMVPRMRRGTLRLDGFASVRAEAAGGEMITKPITFTGSRLVLNHVTAPTGSVRVEIQDANGTPIPGYALANSTARSGDNLEETMSWTGGSDISALAGTPIRLRFVLKDSDVYTMRFTN